MLYVIPNFFSTRTLSYTFKSNKFKAGEVIYNDEID